MLKQESKVEADRRRNDIVHAEDFVSPSKKLLALGTLYSSLVRRGCQSVTALC